MSDSCPTREGCLSGFTADQLLHALLCAREMAVAIIDRERIVRWWSDRAEAVLGYSCADMIGFPIDRYAGLATLAAQVQFHGPDRSPFPRSTTQVLLLRQDGTPIYLTCTIAVIDGDPDQTHGLLCLLEELPPNPPAPPPAEGTLSIDARWVEESNHRVRNSLAMICALLEMQMIHLAEAERAPLRISLARVRALALIHDLFLHDAEKRVSVSTLMQAVLDSLLSLYGHPEAKILVTDTSGARMCSRRGTYLALAITEIGEFLIRCAVERGHPDFPRLLARQEDNRLIITITGTPCKPDACCPELSVLSREILTGLIEQSLAGRITFHADFPFNVTLDLPMTAEK